MKPDRTNRLESRCEYTTSQHAYRRIYKIACICWLWGSSTVMSGTYVGLRAERSQNILLLRWQNFVSERLGSSHAAVLLLGLIISTAGYTAGCMSIYWSSQDLAAVVSLFCLALAFIEGWWNQLRLTAAERILVLLPVALNCGLTWVLACSRTQEGRIQSDEKLSADP